ncbi:MAG: glycosyltransferase, partial [Candidatus Moranbacteria bacterium]|nr:glycosyltransferase [Candidatus Moranbacteria bacterium]
EQETNFNLKIIVIDNSCNNENAGILREGLGKYPNIELVINEKNSGYPKAHNDVKDRIEGEYVMILNPDILLKEKTTLAEMVAKMEADPEIGILGPKQVDDNGNVAMSVRAFPNFFLQVSRRTFLRNLPVLKGKVAYDEMRHLDYSQTQDVDWLQSSCVLIRRDLWEKVGGFNDGYFLFMADVEICLKAWQNGYRVVYYPEAQVYADGKRVSAGGFGAFFKNWVLRQHVKDSLRYSLAHLLSSDPRKKYYAMKAEHGNR